MPRLSIVVPVCNVEKYLDECLKSIENQTFRDLEIICVNDGSKDSSLEILKAHAARDERVKVIDKPNAGYGHTMNKGIASATGEYVGIVESDDFVESDMFQTLMDKAVASNLDIVRCNYWLYWSKPEPRDDLFEAFRNDVAGRVFNPRDVEQCFYFPPALWSSIVRRDLLVNNGLKLLETPGASYQDTSFSFKIWACAQRAELVYKPYLHYRQDNESSSINNKAKVDFVCTEYAEIERFVVEDAQDMSLMPIAQRRKYDAYMWNIGRIDPSLRPDFAATAAAQFSSALEKGWLDRGRFTDAEWDRLSLLMKDTDAFLDSFDHPVEERVPFLKRVFRKLIK